MSGIDYEKINETVKKRYSDSPNGTECVFIKLTDKWGIKLYAYEKYRDSCYKWQKLAAEHGLGPEVGEKLDLPDDNFRSKKLHEFGENYIGRFGYITEIVEVPIEQKDFDSWEDYREALQEIEDTDIYQKEYEELIKELDKINFDYCDLFSGNIGYKNGKMICIDFGYQYCEEDY